MLYIEKSISIILKKKISSLKILGINSKSWLFASHSPLEGAGHSNTELRFINPENSKC